MEIDEKRIEKLVQLGYVEAVPEESFKYRLQLELVSEYTEGEYIMEKKKKGLWKPIVVFGLSTLSVAALIGYGIWLPTTIDFLSRF